MFWYAADLLWKLQRCVEAAICCDYYYFLMFSFIAQCPTRELHSQSVLICLLAVVAWSVQIKYPCCASRLERRVQRFLGTVTVPYEHVWALT